VIYVQRIKGNGPRITIISVHGCADTEEAAWFIHASELRPGPSGNWCMCRVVQLGESLEIITPALP
jgi:hypothetical protein